MAITRHDVERATRAWWQGDLGVASELLRQNPSELRAALDAKSPLDQQPWESWARRRMFFAALRTIEPVAAFRPVLVEMALEARRDTREVARALLASDPPIETIREAIHSGDKDTRALAATWLAELRVISAIPALTAAFRKEKVETTRAAQLRALAGLGVPVHAFLDRSALVQDAEKLVAKSGPVLKKLEFLLLDLLPVVHFTDGEELPRVVVAAWLVTAHKTKSPMASPLLTALAAQLVADEREQLGAAIFQQWMELELELPTDLPPDAVEFLHSAAERRGLTVEQYARHPEFKTSLSWAYQASGTRPPERTSALDHRGVLAVASALAPRTLVPQFVRDVTRFRGLRIGVSRALLHALAGMEDRAATQALIRFSMRFRTASLRKEAERLVEELAATRGWTPDELAERTIPTCGLDERGALALAFVEARAADAEASESDDESDERPTTRRFEARLQLDGALELFELASDGSSTRLAKLPEPRQAEDGAVAAAEKKRLAAAKKELQSTVRVQSDRLFAAMCSERRIRFEDVRTLYVEHPVMRVLLQRVVLVARDAAGERLGPCRLTEDGSFTTPSDATLELAPDATLTVAHASGLAADEIAALHTQLADYRVAPLFPQLDRTLHTLDASQPGLLRIAPPAGSATVSSFALRGRMKRLGWERGPSGDGGYVDTYERKFIALGLEAVLVHDPVPQPETDTSIQVHGVEVRRMASGEEGLPQSTALVLEAIPTVLRHEVWNDLVEALRG